MQRRLVLLAVIAGCGHQPSAVGPARVEGPNYAAPVVASGTTTEPRNIACSKEDAAVDRKYRTVSSDALYAAAVSRPMPRLDANDGGAAGQYLVSVDTDGHVAAVRIFQAVRGNLAIASALCQWKFQPQPEPTRAVLWMGFNVRPH